MDQRVFPRPCVGDKDKEHRVRPVAASGIGIDDRALYCTRCGDAVKLSVAMARTPTPTVGIEWTQTIGAGTAETSNVRS